MPNIKSAKKRVKVANVKGERNKGQKSEIKTVVKTAEAAAVNKTENAEAVIKAAMKTVDQAASKGLIHKNNAARKKSQLAKKLNATK